MRLEGLVTRKALGQHFLLDPSLLETLARDSGVSEEDRVWEVGTGPGTLTRRLADQALEVVTVEKDERMLAFARRELESYRNIRFLCADVLERKSRLNADVVGALQALGPFVWVSNLPYNIATPLIVLVCESGLPWRCASLTLQAEVAERIAAGPGDSCYGAVSVLVAFWARSRLGRKLPPGAFWPPPRVHSRVLHLERSDPSLGCAAEYPAYRQWVKVLFGSRRKQVGPLLRRRLGPAVADALFSRLGWDPRVRAEELRPRDFLELARANSC